MNSCFFVSSSDDELYFGCVARVFCGFWNCILEETEGILRLLLPPTSAGYQLVQFVAFLSFIQAVCWT